MKGSPCSLDWKWVSAMHWGVKCAKWIGLGAIVGLTSSKCTKCGNGTLLEGVQIVGKSERIQVDDAQFPLNVNYKAPWTCWITLLFIPVSYLNTSTMFLHICYISHWRKTHICMYGTSKDLHSYKKFAGILRLSSAISFWCQPAKP